MINWNPALKAKADSLLKDLEDLPNYSEFVLEVQKQATDRLNSLVDGLYQYADLPKPDVAATSHKIIWHEGSTSILDYKGKGQPILLIPSLINKSYILDLTEETSLVKFLKNSGYHPYMLDWGEPGADEKDYNLDNYIERIDKALEEIGEPVIMLGYCMGGLMAISSALKNQGKLKGLALLATPWDFHSDDTERMLVSGKDMDNFSNLLDNWDFVPKELIYLMFYFLDPWPVHKMYGQNYGDTEHIAREYWVHDGIKMATEVAKDCFISWSYNNTPGNGKWQSFGEIVDPSKIEIPTFISIPSYDRVVPPLCAKPLTEMIKNVTTITSPSGHVGMIAGKSAPEHLWQPLKNWLEKIT